MLIIFVGNEGQHFAIPFQPFKWFGLFPTDLLNDRNSRRNILRDCGEINIIGVEHAKRRTRR